VPARVLVYCKKSVADVTAAMLVEELRLADLMTLAEILDLPGGETAAVREMWTHFRIEPADGRLDSLVEIHWHESQRPIQIRCEPTVEGEIDETLENLPPSDRPGAARVRAHLAATREIVELQMGVDGSLHLAATISEVLAFYLAERGDGIVWFYHRDFASPDDRATTLWQTGK
jgi:hypothetical protein